MFLRSVVVTVFRLVWLTVGSGMAATMLVVRTFLHLEGCGSHPLGCSDSLRADKQKKERGESSISGIYRRKNTIIRHRYSFSKTHPLKVNRFEKSRGYESPKHNLTDRLFGDLKPLFIRTKERESKSTSSSHLQSY